MVHGDHNAGDLTEKLKGYSEELNHNPADSNKESVTFSISWNMQCQWDYTLSK